MQYPADVIAAARATGRPRASKGAPFPSATLAQWRLESNGGKSVSGKNNYFGIKATKQQIDAGEATARWTQEFRGGKYVKVTQWFADYSTVEAGFEAHTRLLDTPHYLLCQQAQTPEDYCRALQKDGYATAPNYSAVLISMLESDNLKQ
jgi:flagellum-specific peptidoglycan hydrolase FlgJ